MNLFIFLKCGIHSFFYLADNKSKENKNLKIGMTESSSYFGTSKIFPLEFSFNARPDSLKSGWPWAMAGRSTVQVTVEWELHFMDQELKN